MDAVSATKAIELQRAESLQFFGAEGYQQIGRNSWCAWRQYYKWKNTKTSSVSTSQHTSLDTKPHSPPYIYR